MQLKRGLEIRQEENGKWNVWDNKGDIFKIPFETLEELKEAIREDEMLVNIKRSPFSK